MGTWAAAVAAQGVAGSDAHQHPRGQVQQAGKQVCTFNVPASQFNALLLAELPRRCRKMQPGRQAGRQAGRQSSLLVAIESVAT